ncbi:MAG: right-handed parallel beta-helix repeat-containing protein [Betaproteobacteria bacterium]|nr:right-handed parallel beta-helix repeat-containing protein [Betaproteobacteria bacterium]MBL0292335.1 right-handed parallel beta-helix repeat-containing protein [Betaproteobacteria bacterium]
MKQIAMKLGAMVFVAAVSAAFAAGALAQATRTWVSGVGDDANPCSRTAPCKTFAGAISKTAAGGEINALDPGGFGGVTITKAITINARATMGGVLTSGTNGITVNAGANDVVYLRGLDIVGVGAGTDLSGINFLAGGALHVEDCSIYGFDLSGINFAPSGASALYVDSSTLRNNRQRAIHVHPGLAGSAMVSITNVLMVGNEQGLRVEDAATVVVKNSTASGNGFAGYNVTSSARPAILTLDNSAANGNDGAGVRANGPLSTVRIHTSTVVDNGDVGLASVGGGNIVSFGNNRVVGNAGGNGGPTVVNPQM